MAPSLWSLGMSVPLLAVIACDAQFQNEPGGTDSGEPEEALPPLALAYATDDEHLNLQCMDVIDDGKDVRRQVDPEDFDVDDTELHVYASSGKWWEDCFNDFTRESQNWEESRMALVLISREAGDGEGQRLYALQVLAFLQEDVMDDTVSEAFLGGSPQKGFHVFQVVPCTADDAQMNGDCLKPTERDLRTVIFGSGGGSTSPPNPLAPYQN